MEQNQLRSNLFSRCPEKLMSDYHLERGLHSYNKTKTSKHFPIKGRQF